MTTPLFSACLRFVQVLLLTLTFAAPGAIADPLFHGPTNGTGGFAPGSVNEVTIAGQPAQVIVGAGYNPATPTYLAYYLHGDEGGYKAWSDAGNPVRQFIDQKGLVFVAPRAPEHPEGGAFPWDGRGRNTIVAQPENAAQIKSALDYMFARYNVHRDRVLGAGASGGSWFHDGYFFPKLGNEYPSFFNLNCGSAGMRQGFYTYDDAVALSQIPDAVAASQLKYTIGTADPFHYANALLSVPNYTAMGFSVRSNFLDGVGHCAHDVAAEITDYWTASLQTFANTTPPVTSLNLRAATVPATGSITLTWDSTPGVTYAIQYCESQLDAAANWLPLTTLSGAAAPAAITTFTDSGTLKVAGRTRRFYRIGITP